MKGGHEEMWSRLLWKHTVVLEEGNVVGWWVF